MRLTLASIALAFAGQRAYNAASVQGGLHGLWWFALVTTRRETVNPARPGREQR